MRIDEIDSRSVVQKLKDLIDNPSTNPNVKATAERKLAALTGRHNSKVIKAYTDTKPSSSFSKLV